MNKFEKNNASPPDKGGDGVRIVEHGNRGLRMVLLYKLLAVILVACFAAYLVNMSFKSISSEAGSTNFHSSVSDKSLGVTNAGDIASSLSSSNTISARDQKPTARAAHISRDPNDLSNYIAAGQTPKMEEVIERLHDAGIRSGLGAFNPPGTSPPMIGLAVPDDYVLPEGYVRHFQATDDGQRIEPILMYSPDFEFFDSAGQRIVIPENRVVPNNMAPPGLVIRPIQLPRPLEPGGP
jgi:hypothetical protein